MSTDLDDVIGALVTAVARARRMADEESAAIAEHYRRNPLLAGMSVPRVRLPEVSIDVPVVVDDFEAGRPGVAATPAAVSTAARTTLKEVAAERGVKLPTGLLSSFRDRFDEGASQLPKHADLRTAYGDLADRTFIEVVGSPELGGRLDPDVVREARRRIRDVVERGGVEQTAAPANLRVSVLTSAVQQVPADRVTRLQIHLREEGLEWTTIENEDGSESHRLVPE